MAQRLSTTATSDSGTEWSPTSDVTLQIQQPDDSTVLIECRADPAAPWHTFREVRAHEDRIVKLVRLPHLRISCENPSGGQVSVWSD